jgi:hypothetical protein
MSRKTVYVLAGVFAALVALVALSRYIVARPNLPMRPPIDLATVSQETVDRVTVREGRQRLVLVKAGLTWRIGEGSQTATASPAQVEAFFAALKAASFERLVTRETKDIAAYGLDAAKARTVVVSSGDTTRAAFLVGSPTEDPGAGYLQALGDKAVWVVAGDLRTATDPNPTIWRAPPAARPTPAPTSTGAPAQPPANP